MKHRRKRPRRKLIGYAYRCYDPRAAGNAKARTKRKDRLVRQEMESA